MKPLPSPRVEIHSFLDKSLPEHLNLTKQPFVDNAFEQLDYIWRYMNDEEIKCQSVVIERHYIDRDYIEDYSIFYSRSLYPYENYCQRIHFFSLPKDELQDHFFNLRSIARTDKKETFQLACREFSEINYLGFSVIKPLGGCPVGRTVLKCFGENASKGLKRYFQPTREYKTHLTGVELTIRGLAFQQQDVGVSACATTAIWTSLHKARDLERMAAPTPAKITILASEKALPFGRSMPSRGLSLDQMCQAIQAVGVSPSLIRVTDFNTARSYLYSAISSGFAPILIINSGDTYHAITACGMKVDPQHFDRKKKSINVIELSENLKSVFVHDDRYGPYQRADLKKIKAVYRDKKRTTSLSLSIDNRKPGEKPEEWNLTHILIPLHAKIRLSFDLLKDAAGAVIHQVESLIVYQQKKLIDVSFTESDKLIYLELLINRAFNYSEDLLTDQNKLDEASFLNFSDSAFLSRYVGVIRINSSIYGMIDILVDTTSTSRNIRCSAVIIRQKKMLSRSLGLHLAESFSCPFIDN